MKIINASLMTTGAPNGFTAKMQAIATEGYWELNPSHPQFNQELLQLTLEHKPNLIFLQIQAAEIINVVTAKEIAKYSIVFNFNGDVREYLDSWYWEIGKVIHCTFMSNMRDVRTLRGLGVDAEWLDCGIDPDIYKPHPEIIQDYDIVAHFNHYGTFPLSDYRWKAVKRLKEEFGSKFDVFGNFPGARSDFNADQRAESRNYCHAKIAINISHFKISQYSSDRLGRIMATGTPMCLTHNFPMIHEIYYPGQHLISFDDLDDMVFKCKYFLKYEDERLRIVRLGHQHFLKNYTFEKMCEKIKFYYKKYENND